MVAIQKFLVLMMAYEPVSEQMHFEKRSFQINKKFVAAPDETRQHINVKFSLVDQSVFCSITVAIVYPAYHK